jgi:hypothetical protein
VNLLSSVLDTQIELNDAFLKDIIKGIEIGAQRVSGNILVNSEPIEI